MKAYLEQARGSGEEVLKEAAEFVKMLPRDKDGVFAAFQPDLNVYEAGRLSYPVYMEFETKFGKKAGYADIAAQLTCLGKRLAADYETKEAADFIRLLVDTLFVMSPEIYEHYRSLQDLLKENVKQFVQKEGLVLNRFPEEKLNNDLNGKEPTVFREAGEAIVRACEEELLSTEKYQVLGRCLQAI